MNTIEFDKVYRFDLTGTISFGDLTTNIVIDIFKDGRVSSKLLENILPIWFPELTYVDQHGYDHIDEC